MDPEVLEELAKKNAADLEAIISTIGISNLISLLPNIIAICKTLQATTTKTVTKTAA